MCWAGAAKRLEDRDEWIGWDAVTCANRWLIANSDLLPKTLAMDGKD